MKIQYAKNEEKRVSLGTLCQGTVFRFPNTYDVHIVLGFDGYDLERMEKARNGYSTRELLGAYAVPLTEELYEWGNSADELDSEYYEESGIEELAAYMCLSDNLIHLSHKDEAVVLLDATLTVKERA